MWNLSVLVADVVEDMDPQVGKYAFSFPLRIACNSKPVTKQKSRRLRRHTAFPGNKHELRVKTLV